MSLAACAPPACGPTACTTTWSYGRCRTDLRALQQQQPPAAPMQRGRQSCRRGRACGRRRWSGPQQRRWRCSHCPGGPWHPESRRSCPCRHRRRSCPCRHRRRRRSRLRDRRGGRSALSRRWGRHRRRAQTVARPTMRCAPRLRPRRHARPHPRPRSMPTRQTMSPRACSGGRRCRWRTCRAASMAQCSTTHTPAAARL